MKVAQLIYQGLRNLYRVSFNHLHRLDLNYHKANSKDTVYEINKAMKSLEMGSYYLLGDVLRLFFEASFVGAALYFTAGWKYFSILFITLASYTGWTVFHSKALLPLMEQENLTLKRREAFHLEQILLYDTVHQFGREPLSH
mmetsp:Transcript_14140/g.24011  ORF Transcript_14140/g.24011 Transcript_14140/m.24011 type:complete len:142 (-) Transcript_14140:1340-1765(-)